MKAIQNIFVAFFAICSIATHAQEATNIIDSETPVRYTAHNKGKFFVYWGGNRSKYSSSDIRFQGDDYDFTLQDVNAQDKPKGWHIDYINPSRITIPQTNVRFGYFITDKYHVSLGYDHMKYVMKQNQQVNYSGYYPNEGSYGEKINDDLLQLTEDFVQFEHTDGLNYIHAEIGRMDDLSKYVWINNTDKIQLNATYAIGGGFIFPKTNAKILGKERHDDFNIAGYGLSAKAGLNLVLFKHFFIQYDAKVGHINMNNVRTTQSKADKASHHFNFLETTISFGGIFRI